MKLIILLGILILFHSSNNRKVYKGLHPLIHMARIYNIYASRIITAENTGELNYAADLRVKDGDPMEMPPHYNANTPTELGHKLAEVEQPLGTEGIIFRHDSNKSMETPIKAGGFVDLYPLEREERKELLIAYQERFNEKNHGRDKSEKFYFKSYLLPRTS